MNKHVEQLLQILSLETLEINLFRGQSRDIGTEQVFGGQVLGQAILAAQQTVDQRNLHSLHAYFLRHGDHGAPIIYEVERSRDGQSFSSRRVVAVQYGRRIFTMSTSFQIPETDFEYQLPSAQVPSPDEVPTVEGHEQDRKWPAKLRRLAANVSVPFEIRPIKTFKPVDESTGVAWRQAWFRLRSRPPAAPAVQHAILAYLSDYGLLPTALLPHDLDGDVNNIRIASIDHAMWFHRPFVLDDWLLFKCDPISSSNARGLARGYFFDRQGVLIATVLQEGLLRSPR